MTWRAPDLSSSSKILGFATLQSFSPKIRILHIYTKFQPDDETTREEQRRELKELDKNESEIVCACVGGRK